MYLFSSPSLECSSLLRKKKTQHIYNKFTTSKTKCFLINNSFVKKQKERKRKKDRQKQQNYQQLLPNSSNTFEKLISDLCFFIWLSYFFIRANNSFCNWNLDSLQVNSKSRMCVYVSNCLAVDNTIRSEQTEVCLKTPFSNFIFVST